MLYGVAANSWGIVDKRSLNGGGSRILQGFDGCKAVGLLLTKLQGFVTVSVTGCAGVSSLFWGIL